MNPLIDVCLVLLIFFILTITYASLERAIDVPQLNPDQKGPSQGRLEGHQGPRLPGDREDGRRQDR